MEPLVCAITGSTGYVGSVLTSALTRKMPIVALNRRPSNQNGIQWDLNSDSDISRELRGRDVSVLVHAAWDMHANTLSEMRKICVEGSRRLYKMASNAGIQRIVFISTISAFSGCRSAYGKSKLEVEELTRERGGIILRPGLIYGSSSGGVFGAMRNQVLKSSLIPLIGNGRAPQYLLDESTMGQTVIRAVKGDLDDAGMPITVAHPQPWPFRELLRKIALDSGRNIWGVPIPWPLLYVALRAAEKLRIRLPIRSDSIISFVYQDRDPDFTAMHRYGIHPAHFSL